MSRPERRREISDPHTLRALAHPLRLALMRHLLAEGPATATRCAAALGDTTPNCSYHLRRLAAVRLVDAVPSDDARERPWRAAVTGFGIARPSGHDGHAAVRRVYASIEMAERDRLTRAFLDRFDHLDARWRPVGGLHLYGLRVTADELAAATAAIDAILRPLLAATRADPPPGARVVDVVLDVLVGPA